MRFALLYLYLGPYSKYALHSFPSFDIRISELETKLLPGGLDQHIILISHSKRKHSK